MALLRNEYPRPNYVRPDWLTLNGEWRFAFDDQNRGLLERWYDKSLPGNDTIVVPFAYQSDLSGIADTSDHPVVWYQREFEMPKKWTKRSILLNFGAVDYACTVWVNGSLAGTNKGGYVSFTLDITPYIEQSNVITVRVEDYPVTSQPRGKQRAKKENHGCWYTPVTGIWQSVWLEAVGECYLDRVKLEPNIQENTLKVHYWLSVFVPGLTLKCQVFQDGKELSSVTLPLKEKHNYFSDIIPRKDGSFVVAIPDALLWSPEKPFLYDLKFSLTREENVVDEVQTYVGMREVTSKNGKIHLNGRPYYLRLVLDQGFWPEGIYTAKSTEEIKYDVEMTKKFGFNGARKHQKFEDPYYYYYCDRLGLLTWCEMPACYYYDEEVSQNMTDEWQRLVVQHYNFPSVMAWVPINESWGVDQIKERGTDRRPIHHMITLYHLTKSLDGTRLVVGNDGWEQAVTDIIAIHDYTQDPDDFRARYAKFKEDRHARSFSHNLPILLDDYPYTGQPIMVTEFGGIKVQTDDSGWGYGQAARDNEELIERIKSLVDFILDEPEICGFCYTQLTDVEQEVNGLLTYDRKPRVSPETLKEIFGRKR